MTTTKKIHKTEFCEERERDDPGDEDHDEDHGEGDDTRPSTWDYDDGA